ncbi:MAG: hypothetical protein JXB88_10840 [Spirochaetales bacterium]|nr:hypothetical protein [Spirochaetales bacterium]
MEEKELEKNQNQYDIFSTRDGCNNVKRYLDAVMDIIYDFEGYENLANILHRYVADELIQIKHIPSIISLVLVDKYKYHYSSYNLENDVTNFDAVVKEFRKWNAVDIMFVYFHPELGIFPLNPKNKAHFSRVKLLKQSELVSLYTGLFQNTDGDKVFDIALEKAILLLKGYEFKTPQVLTAGDMGKEAEEEEEEEEEAPVIFFVEESPFYGIPVTNNQFHNGNVEAWKKIIRSYVYTFPDVKVIIYYNREEVRDIDSLFQWGKIKPGTVINIKVIGKDLRNKRMSALVYHLKEGASPYFERYIKGNPRMVLKLFGNV